MTGGMLRDADIKPELGVATYTIYPEVRYAYPSSLNPSSNHLSRV